MQNKKPFEIILHVGVVTSLQSWVAKKSCHSQTLINECSISDRPSNFEGLVITSFATAHPDANVTPPVIYINSPSTCECNTSSHLHQQPI